MSELLEDLEESVIKWARDKGIFAKATPIKQAEKTGEEYAEMMRALGKQELFQGLPGNVNMAREIEDEIKDSIGDQVVTLIIQAHMQGTTLGECLEKAYNTIAKRTGNMVDGKFVKDE